MESKTILVVDDDPEFRSLLCAILHEGGYATESAFDGQDGLEKARILRPAMILLDVQMPRLDGYQTTAALRKDPLFDAVPIVLVTVQSQIPEIAKGLRMGADDHITKPFHTGEVLVRIKSLFVRGREPLG